MISGRGPKKQLYHCYYYYYYYCKIVSIVVIIVNSIVMFIVVNLNVIQVLPSGAKNIFLRHHFSGKIYC